MSSAVVVGGGIAGLLSAHALCQRGFQVTLLDADKAHAGASPAPGVAGLLEVRCLRAAVPPCRPHVLCSPAYSLPVGWTMVLLSFLCYARPVGVGTCMTVPRAMANPCAGCRVRYPCADVSRGTAGPPVALPAAVAGGQTPRRHPPVQPPTRPGHGRLGGNEDAAARLPGGGGCWRFPAGPARQICS